MVSPRTQATTLLPSSGPDEKRVAGLQQAAERLEGGHGPQRHHEMLLIALPRAAVQDLNVQVGQASRGSGFIVPLFSMGGPSAILRSGEACEAACDRSVPVFPEHPVQGVKGAVREPPRARQKPVVLWFEAVGWRLPSLLAHLSILRHCLPGGRCARSSRRASAGARCEGSSSLASRRRRSLAPLAMVSTSSARVRGTSLDCARPPVAMALGHPGKVVNRGSRPLAMADCEIQGMEVGVLAHALPASCVANGARKKAMVCPFCSAMIAGLVREQYT